ncbi:MAG: hypothetical protein MI723_14605, partial [Caulobacterales bacterium]|nr:hypothetical protein [Caulobacterales bacterium]
MNTTNKFAALYPDEGSSVYDIANNVVDTAPGWLHLWSLSIEDINIGATYTNVSKFRDNGTNTTISDTVSYSGRNYPCGAVAIIEAAGREPAYEPLRGDVSGVSVEAEGLTRKSNVIADVMTQTDCACEDQEVRIESCKR